MASMINNDQVPKSGPSSGGTPENFSPSDLVKPAFLQKIHQKKMKLKGLSKLKKLEQIGLYSNCKSDGCRCNSWKNPNAGQTAPPAPKETNTRLVVSLQEPCKNCNHPLSSHVMHIENAGEDELNRLLSMIVDIENIMLCVQKEEDGDTKQVYFYLYKLVRK